MLVGFFYLLCNLWCKSNLISIISSFYGVSDTAWHRASGIRCRRWRLWLAAAACSTNNDVIAERPLRRLIRYVPYVPYVALDGNPALGLYC